MRVLFVLLLLSQPAQAADNVLPIRAKLIQCPYHVELIETCYDRPEQKCCALVAHIEPESGGDAEPVPVVYDLFEVNGNLYPVKTEILE